MTPSRLPVTALFPDRRHGALRPPGRAARGAAALALALAFAPLAALGQESDGLEPVPSVIAPLADRSLLLDIDVAGDRLVAVGERGHILLSDDSGVSWRQVPAPVSVVLTAVQFVNETTGWAVGHDAAILHTVDAGESWELVQWAPEDESPLLDVWFADESNGFAIGAYGSFYATTDGGANWESRSISDLDFHLQHLTRSPEGTLYIAAEAGTVYRSDDGGSEWSELPSPYEGSFFGTLPLADNVVLLFGLRGHAYRSEDAGETWVEVDSHTQAMLTAAIQLDDGRVVIVGLVGSVLVSDDGGRTFQLHAQQNRQGISSIVRAPDGALVIVGEGGARRLDLAELAAGGNGGGER